MTTFASRKLVLYNILVPNRMVVTQDPAQPIVLGNSGAFNAFNQIVVPVGNTGTLLSFVGALDGYEYIDVLIEGTAAILAVYTPNKVISVTAGSSGSDKASYTIRIPYCGKITSMLFTQIGVYTIKSITLGLAQNKYNIARDLSQVSIIPFAGLVDNGDTLVIPVLNGSTVAFKADVNLLDEYSGKLRVNIFALTLQPTQNYTYTDGVFTYSCNNLAPVDIFIADNSKTYTVNYTNNSGVTQYVEFKPRVASYLPISTSYGAHDDPVSAVVADYYVDNTAGIGSDANNGTSPFTPFLTLAKVKAVVQNNQKIALRRGCEWNEAYADRLGKTGVTLCAYGTGRKPLINAFSTVPAGEISYTNPNLFVTIAHIFPVSVPQYFIVTENDRKLTRAAADTGVPGTYFITASAGSTATFKVYPYAGDNGVTGAHYTNNSTTRVYKISNFEACVEMYTGCSVQNIHMRGNMLYSFPGLMKGVCSLGRSTTIDSCIIEDYIGVGITQESGLATNNVVMKPSRTSLESPSASHYCYGTPRNSTTGIFYGFGGTPGDDATPLTIQNNTFDTFLPSSDMNVVTTYGISVYDIASFTYALNNIFRNLSVSLSLQTTRGNPLFFAGNAIYNFSKPIELNGTGGLTFTDNFVFCNPDDRSFSMTRFMQMFTAGPLIVQRNLMVLTHNLLCSIEIGNTFVCTAKIQNNTMWFNNDGGAAAGPFLKLGANCTITFDHNFMLQCQTVVQTLGGSVIPPGTWDNNRYGQITAYSNMFVWGSPTYTTLAAFKAGAARDTNSTVGNYPTPRAAWGDITPTGILTADAGIGAPSYDLSVFKRPISLPELYAQ